LTAASIDHLVSLIIFVSAIMLFIGMFSQTIQTGVDYQLHKAVSSKASDLLDNMLLSPGLPPEWGQTGQAPEGFGLQAVEFTQYQLSSFSPMRLRSSIGAPVYYDITGQTYSNITMGFGQSLLVPYDEALDYSTASRLLGINGSYGFSLTLSPIVNVEISQQADPRSLSISAWGPGFPLANAEVDYCLIRVVGTGEGSPPTYVATYGSLSVDKAGSASLSLGFDGNSESYALIASAHLSGLAGIGYYENSLYNESYVIPFISFTNQTAILAHSLNVIGGDPDVALNYNAAFAVIAEDFTLRVMPFANGTGSSSGLLNCPQNAYDSLTLSTNSPGILIVTYSKNASATGIVVMPWGLSSLAFPVTFGGEPRNSSWVATDIRQVMINGIAYQAKLAVWSLSGYQVNG
jgi:hypothetical protein